MVKDIIICNMVKTQAIPENALVLQCYSLNAAVEGRKNYSSSDCLAQGGKTTLYYIPYL